MERKKAKRKIHVKKGDTVVVATGKDAGKKGKIIDINPTSGRVYVDKLNLVSRHTKPTQAAPQGGIIKKEAPMDSSNVMPFCAKCDQGVRVKKQLNANGTKSRVCAKCGANLDN